MKRSIRNRLAIAVGGVAVTVSLALLIQCGGGDSSNQISAFNLAGTWRVSWVRTQCMGDAPIAIGGTQDDYLVTPIDSLTIEFVMVATGEREQVALTQAADGGLEFIRDDTFNPEPAIVCERDQKERELQAHSLIHFYPDAQTGYVDRSWTLGANTACLCSSDTVRSSMVIVLPTAE